MTDTNLINNWLFAAISEADQDALRPNLVRRALAQGDVLFGQATSWTSSTSRCPPRSRM